MAHADQIDFIRAFVARMVPVMHKEVVEYGAFDVNGHIRDQFSRIPGIRYTGIDLIEGPNVDVVADASTYRHPVPVQVAVSCECLEHNPHWRATVANMLNSLAPDGIAAISFATLGRKEHGTARSDPSKSPGTSAVGWNYYRNLRATELQSAIEAALPGARCLIATNLVHFDVMAIVAGPQAPYDFPKALGCMGGDRYRMRERAGLYLIEDVSLSRRLKQRVKYHAEQLLGGNLYQMLLLSIARR